jgi:hypothetical protein
MIGAIPVAAVVMLMWSAGAPPLTPSQKLVGAAQQAWFAGDVDDAINKLRDAAQIDHKAVEARVILARLLVFKGDDDAALEQLRAAAGVRPFSDRVTTARLALMTLEIEREQHANDKPAYARRRAADALVMAEAAARAGRGTQTAVLLKRALALDERRIDDAARVMEVLTQNGDVDTGCAWILLLVNRSKAADVRASAERCQRANKRREAIAQANAAFERNDWPTAVQRYEEALALAPRQMDIGMPLVTALVQSGGYQRAGEVLLAVERFGSNLDARRAQQLAAPLRRLAEAQARLNAPPDVAPGVGSMDARMEGMQQQIQAAMQAAQDAEMRAYAAASEREAKCQQFASEIQMEDDLRRQQLGYAQGFDNDASYYAGQQFGEISAAMSRQSANEARREAENHQRRIEQLQRQMADEACSQ